MNQEAQEMIERAVEKLREVREVKAVILFGSHATGKATPQSDIDLLVVVNVENPKKLLQKTISKLRGIDPEGKISTRLTNLKDLDEDFLSNVLREGKPLFGKIVVTPEKLLLQPYYLLSYDLTNLSGSRKVQISKAINGYISKKTIKGKAREYIYKGLIDEFGVQKINDAVYIIPETQKGFIEFLEREKIKFTTTKIWK